jgi:hypothetical protein
MTLRTVLFSFVLAACTVAAPPALGTARACGGYVASLEEQVSRSVTSHIVEHANKSWGDVEIVSVSFRDDGSAWVSARIREGEGRAMRRGFVARRASAVRWNVTPTYFAFAERLTQRGWVRA